MRIWPRARGAETDEAPTGAVPRTGAAQLPAQLRRELASFIAALFLSICLWWALGSSSAPAGRR